MHSVEFVEVSGKFLGLPKAATTLGADLHVRGFASVRGVDRHGDDIPPRLFDVDTFLRNPQLWYNHELYPTARGMAPIGRVEAMHVVRASEQGDKLRLEDVRHGSEVAVIDPEDFLVKNGDEGVWVVARVMEPDVIAFIRDGRLNAFSWAGTIMRRPDGRIARVDVREVSLVFLPANARALFVVGKSGVEPGTTFLVRDGVAHPCRTEDGLSPSKQGKGYVFLLRAANGVSHLVAAGEPVKSDDDALALGRSYARDVHHVMVLKNQWRAGTDGAVLYALLHHVEGAAGQIPADPDDGGLDYDPTPWPEDYVRALPSSAFAFVCEADERRYFPYRDARGAVDPDALKRSFREACASPYYARALPVLSSAASEAGLRGWLDDRAKAQLTAEEQRLLGEPGSAPVTAATPQERGGEDVDTKQILEKLTGLEQRMAQVEAARKDGDGGDEPAATPPATPAAPAAPVTQSVPETPAAPVTPAAAPTPAAPAAGDPATAEAIEGVGKALGAVVEAIERLNQRVSKIEGAPVGTRQVTDAEADEPATASVADAVAKALSKLPPEERKRVKTRALDDHLFGDARREIARMRQED